MSDAPKSNPVRARLPRGFADRAPADIAATNRMLEAIRLKPDFAAAHSNLGNAYFDQGKLDLAIASYRKGLAAEQMVASADTSPLAAVGARVAVDAVVVRSVYSQNYNVHFVTARTQCNRLVFFSYREGLDADTPIRVRGTVKAHRPDSTQLNRVKLV